MSASKDSIGAQVDILIAQNDSAAAAKLKCVLESCGHNVTVVSNGRHAMEAALTRKPALIVSDIAMPELDGYELCRVPDGRW